MIEAIIVDDSKRYVELRVLLREWYLDSLTLVPMLCLLGAVILTWIMKGLQDYLLDWVNAPTWLFGSTGAAISVTSVIASSMLSFLAVVFSVTLVALQLASQQFTPRVLRTFIRSPIVKIMLGLSVGTFAYSVLILFFGISRSEAIEPVLAIAVDVVLVFIATIYFVIFVKEILTMIRIGYIISIVAEETHDAIQDVFPPQSSYRQCSSDLLLEQPNQLIHYQTGKPFLFGPSAQQGVFVSVSSQHLVQLARKHGCLIKTLPDTGDFIVNGDPVLEVYGDVELSSQDCLATFFVEPERTIQDDPAYGFRALVDIGLQALSPAVNAPTTATQVIYRLVALLLTMSKRPTPTGYFADTDNIVRLVRPTMAWDEYVDLAFGEIIEFGATSSQVCHTLQWAFNRLLVNVPPDFQEPLQKQQRRLQAAESCQ